MKKWYVITALLLVALLLAACTDPRPSNEASENAALPTPNQNVNGSAAMVSETEPAGLDPQPVPTDPAATQPADASAYSPLPAEESEVYEVIVTEEGEVGMLGDD